MFQVVRKHLPNGKKVFPQRRPDPQKNGGWIWDLEGVNRVVYRLPELIAKEPDTGWVYIVEGEKDADALAALGMTATTNPEGQGKWKAIFNPVFRDRLVAIIPDNDDVGRTHALRVAGFLKPFAAQVRIIELEGLPPKGDVSDWLAGGHNREELEAVVESAGPFQLPDSSNGNGVTIQGELWEGGKWRPIAANIIQSLRAHGFFVNAEGRFYYFDQTTKTLFELDSFELALILNEGYQVNQSDTLYPYLIHQLEVEASIRGTRSVVRQFAHYDPETNVMFLDMNNGTLLRLDGKKIEVRDNGADNVLFAPVPFAEPWGFVKDVPDDLLTDIIIKPLNFAQNDERLRQ